MMKFRYRQTSFAHSNKHVDSSPCMIVKQAMTVLASLLALCLSVTVSSTLGCYPIKTGFHLDSVLYVTNGTHYATVSNGNNTGNLEPISDIGLNFEPDASLSCNPCNSDKPALFFHGNEFYKFIPGRPIKGPYKAEKLNSFLKNGVDAAATKNGFIHFFKGCHYLRMPFLDLAPAIAKKYFDYVKLLTHILGPPKEGYLPDAGLPCDVDAAWEYHSDMVVVKGNTSYIWEASENKAKRHPIPENGLLELFCEVSHEETTTVSPSTNAPACRTNISTPSPTSAAVQHPTKELVHNPTEAQTEHHTKAQFYNPTNASAQNITGTLIEHLIEADVQNSTDAQVHNHTEPQTDNSTEAQFHKTREALIPHPTNAVHHPTVPNQPITGASTEKSVETTVPAGNPEEASMLISADPLAEPLKSSTHASDNQYRS